MRILLETLLLPPADLLMLSAIGVFLLRSRRRLGLTLILGSLVGFYVLSLPLVGKLLLMTVSVPDRVPSNAQAIVVLSAGLRNKAHEFGEDAPDDLTLERLRYAAYLERKTHLPILVSGGALPSDEGNLAQVMAETLKNDYGIDARWVEDKSLTTAENAKFSAAILKASGISRIYLVSHGWHLARALLAFRRTGLTVYPAGTVYPVLKRSDFYDPIPEASAFRNSCYSLHEILGYFWYLLSLPKQEGAAS
ncbi:MAG: YdcF family protein [Alphaproteobacteria bacterium]